MSDTRTLGFGSQDNQPSTKQRRSRAGSSALSCAECRRLKLKCSRIFPCSTCVKKGCGAICPDGALTTGKGNRFVLANTEVLHEKILELSSRVRQLEDALAKSHSLFSMDRHPLLTDELLLVKRPLEREQKDQQPTTEREPQSEDLAEEVDSLGSLAISHGGRASFYGTTANSWYLLQNEDDGSNEDIESRDVSSPDVPWITHAFPFASNIGDNIEDIRLAVLSMLPSASVAQNLSDIYFRHAAWMYTPIMEQDYYQTIFRQVYGLPSNDSLDSHSIAVLYMILAFGSLMDLDLPPNSPQAAQYYQLSRTALALESIFEEQSIAAIQALLLMCHFMFLSGIESSRWVIMGIVVKLTHSVGLHRDSGKWNLDPEETKKRRSLMWEIYVYDSWQSLTFGRPPSFALAHIDCPMADEVSPNPSGEVEMSFAAWKHRFSSQCLSVIHDRVFGARTPSYKTMQELDKKVRDFYIPPSLQVPGFGGSKLRMEIERPSLQLTMQRYIAFAIREITLFYMHRGFFARAMETNSEDPLGSKFAPSVLAAYTSACSFIGLIESLFAQHPLLTERMFFLFSHVFSCAIVLGSIAIKSRMALAPSALSHLQSACHLFSQISQNLRAAKVLPILTTLRDRARDAALDDPSRRQPPFLPHSESTVQPTVTKDELSALGGMTRLVSKRAPSKSAPNTPLANSDPFPCSSPNLSQSPRSQHAKTPPVPKETPTPAVTRQCTVWEDPRPPFALPSFGFSQGVEYSTQYPSDALSAPLDVPAEFPTVFQEAYLGTFDALSATQPVTVDSLLFAPDPNVAWNNFIAQFQSI